MKFFSLLSIFHAHPNKPKLRMISMMFSKFKSASFIRLGILTCACVIAVTGCSPLKVINAIVPEGDVVVEVDQSYGAHPRQKLDIYRPAKAEGPVPTIVFFYGGSWKRGNRADYAFVGQALANEGFMVAVADYRTYPEVKFPTFVDDAAEAVAWISRNADEFGGKTDDIHLIGHSAGAHIAAFLALDGTYLKTADTDRRILGRWAGLAGPYAFYPSEVRSVRDIFSDTPEDTARPITFVDAGTPPALLLHGADDTTVLPKNSTQLAKALRDVGVKAHAFMYDGVGHAPLVLSLSPPFTGIAPTLNDVTAFFKTGKVPVKTIEASR